jgi:hypothetical protein
VLSASSIFCCRNGYLGAPAAPFSTCPSLTYQQVPYLVPSSIARQCVLLSRYLGTGFVPAARYLHCPLLSWEDSCSVLKQDLYWNREAAAAYLDEQGRCQVHSAAALKTDSSRSQRPPSQHLAAAYKEESTLPLTAAEPLLIVSMRYC